MKACTVVCPTADRIQWLAARNTGIGSSDAPALILGKHFGRTPLMIWQEKIGMVDANDDGDLQFGLDLEPYILSKWVNETGRSLYCVAEMLRSREWPFMMTTPDALGYNALGPVVESLFSNEIEWYVEAKTVGHFDGWPDGIPEKYQIQMQHGMAVTGLKRASIPVLGGEYGGFRFGYYDLERDEEFIQDELVPACREFWLEHVEAQVAPPAGPYDAGALVTQHPEAEPETAVQLGGEFLELDAELVANMQAVKEMAVAIDHAKNRIREAIGDAELGMLPSGASWRWSNTKKGRQLRRRKGAR